MKVVAAWGLAIAAFAQSSLPDTPDFGNVLQKVIALASPGPGREFPPGADSHDLDLPGALTCGMNEIYYHCIWEARPNKYSGAQLHDNVVSHVSASIPESWPRVSGQSLTERTTVFGNPAANLWIMVRAPVSEINLALKTYTVELIISRGEPGRLTPDQITSEMHYQSAVDLFEREAWQGSAVEFREALNGDRQPRWIEVWSHIYLGRMYDLTGQRDRAINEYKLAQRTSDNTRGALEEAAKGLITPYTR